MTRYRPSISPEQAHFEARLKAPVVSTHCRSCGAKVQQMTLSSQHCGGSIEVYPPLCDACKPHKHGNETSACESCAQETECAALVMIKPPRAVMCEWASLAWVMER